MHNPHASIGEVFSHAEQLSRAHTVYELTDEEELDSFSIDKLVTPDDVGVMDVGHYKEEDFAIWSILRVSRMGRSAILAARLRRIEAVELTSEGFAVDVVAIGSEEGSDVLEVSRVDGARIRPNLFTYMEGEFSLTYSTLLDVLNPERDRDTAELVNEAPTATSISMEALHMNSDIASAVEDPVTRELLASLHGLSIDQRYVGRSISEREALGGREKTGQLILAIDESLEKMKAGKILGAQKIDLLSDDTIRMYEEWGGPLVDGSVFTISWSDTAEGSNSGNEAEKHIAQDVNPPSILANAYTGRARIYCFQVVDPATRERQMFFIDEATCTVYRDVMLPQQLNTTAKRQHANELSEPIEQLSALVKLHHSNLAESKRYLRDDEIEEIIELLTDSMFVLETVEEMVRLGLEDVPSLLHKLKQTTEVEKVRITELIAEYPDMPQGFKNYLSLKL